MAKSRFRLPLRRLDRVLLVAALLLCAGLLLLPAQEGPYVETPFPDAPEAIPADLDEFLKMSSTDINTADKETLMALPGIGEVLSERILQDRAEHGPFTCVEELGNVSGIGEKKLEALLPEVTVGEGKTEEETAGETPAEDGKESPHADLSGG